MRRAQRDKRCRGHGADGLRHGMIKRGQRREGEGGSETGRMRDAGSAGHEMAMAMMGE